MSRFLKWRAFRAAFSAAAALLPVSASACATCFGGDGSRMSQGATDGILFLLVIILGMLGGVGTFFVCLARRAAAVHALQSATAATPPPAAPVPVSTHS